MIKDIVTGILLGGTMSVPGVSGGTMAIALGCYGQLLRSVADLKRGWGYLLRILLGGIFGFLTVGNIVDLVFDQCPVIATTVFCCAALAGMVRLWKDCNSITLGGIVCFFLGIASVFAVDLAPAQTATSPLFAALCGIAVAAGIILPGISTSHLLVLFGWYDAVVCLNVKELLPLGVGVLLGLLLLTKPLIRSMDRHPAEWTLALLGFSAGSLRPLIRPCLLAPNAGFHPIIQLGTGLVLGGMVFLCLVQNRQDGEKIVTL